MHRLALPVALLAVWAGAANAESVYRGGPVSDARLVVGAGGAPVAAYVANGTLTVAVRGAGGWDSQSPFVLPGRDVELDGLVVTGTGLPTALLRDRAGHWLGVARSVRSGVWHWDVIRPDGKQDLIGPGGLTLDKAGLPVAAYALWHPSRKTALRLVRAQANDTYRTQGITRKGFPETPTLAAAAPVVMPSGQIRVVETYTPAAIEWRPIPGDWIGQFLHGSALGFPTGSVGAAVAGSTVYAAWTEEFPTVGPPAVVLASHGSHTESAVAIDDAVFAALALAPSGPELAANRCVTESSCLGLVGNVGVDGLVAGYAVEPGGARDVLLASDDGLDFVRSPLPLSTVVTLDKDLTGRVQGAGSGSVTLYREAEDGTRATVGTFPVAPDGSFTGADPASGTPPAAYRAVWIDPVTAVPYCAVVATGS